MRRYAFTIKTDTIERTAGNLSAEDVRALLPLFPLRSIVSDVLNGLATSGSYACDGLHLTVWREPMPLVLADPSEGQMPGQLRLIV